MKRIPCFCLTNPPLFWLLAPLHPVRTCHNLTLWLYLSDGTGYRWVLVLGWTHDSTWPIRASHNPPKQEVRNRHVTQAEMIKWNPRISTRRLTTRSSLHARIIWLIKYKLEALELLMNSFETTCKHLTNGGNAESKEEWSSAPEQLDPAIPTTCTWTFQSIQANNLLPTAVWFGAWLLGTTMLLVISGIRSATEWSEAPFRHLRRSITLGFWVLPFPPDCSHTGSLLGTSPNS